MLRLRHALLCAMFVVVACSGSDDAEPGPKDPPPPGADGGEPPAPTDGGPARSPDGLVETRKATALGPTGLSANGAINPKGRPTKYWFEYGPTNAYGSRTPERALTGKLAAHYKEDWNVDSANWVSGLSGTDLAYVPAVTPATGSVRFDEPSDIDQNHIDGVGANQLVSYTWIGTYLPGNNDSFYLGGGDPDLRDARVSVNVRGNNWSTFGAELMFWMQTDLDLAKQNDDNLASRANWAFSERAYTDALFSGRWEHVEYRLENDTNLWSYSGAWLDDPRPRYFYQTLDTALGHLNNDFFQMLVYVNPLRPPTGSIDIDDFELTYHDRSVVFPSNGGKLVASPPMADDPKTLTDGWRHGVGRQWRTAPNPTAPVELIYELANPVAIDTVQIHQSTEWPSKDIEVYASADGTNYTLVSGGAELPATMKAAARGGPNLNFFIDNAARRTAVAAEGGADVPFPKISAKRIKVRILSGYRPEYWGLGEIEVFGSGAVEETDDAWYTVNADLVGLTRGTKYHYRLVASSSAGTTYGGDITYDVPNDARPIVTTRFASRTNKGAARVEARVAPLGLATVAYFEYGIDPTKLERTDDVYSGAQMGPRTVQTQLVGLTPGATYHYRVVGVSSAGKSVGEDLTFVAK